jgi:hypothetical protein
VVVTVMIVRVMHVAIMVAVLGIMLVNLGVPVHSLHFTHLRGGAQPFRA